MDKKVDKLISIKDKIKDIKVFLTDICCAIMFHVKSLTTKEKGNFAEDLAVSFLKRKGYKILARNFYANHAEIDIITKYKQKIIFFEVKSVSRVTLSKNVTQETFDPRFNMNEQKFKRILSAANSFLIKNNLHTDSIYIKLLVLEYSFKEKKALFKIFDLL